MYAWKCANSNVGAGRQSVSCVKRCLSTWRSPKALQSYNNVPYGGDLCAQQNVNRHTLHTFGTFRRERLVVRSRRPSGQSEALVAHFRSQYGGRDQRSRSCSLAEHNQCNPTLASATAAGTHCTDLINDRPAAACAATPHCMFRFVDADPVASASSGAPSPAHRRQTNVCVSAPTAGARTSLSASALRRQTGVLCA